MMQDLMKPRDRGASSYIHCPVSTAFAYEQIYQSSSSKFMDVFTTAHGMGCRMG